MKILLINPPRSPENGILKYAPADAKHFIHKKLIGPPLGLLTIAASVKENHDVFFLDMKGEYDSNPRAPELEKLVFRYLKKYNPDIAGVTFIASEYNDGLEIFRAVKKFNPGIITVAGGLHVTLCPEDFNDPAVDIACIGPGEYTFRKIVEAFEGGRDFSEISGIYINSGKSFRKTRGGIPCYAVKKKNYIVPDRTFLAPWIDTYRVGKSPYPATYIYTSLGCPYRCSFCSIWPQFNGNYYQRDVESIIDELKALKDYPTVRFADANTIVNIRFINKIFDRILEEGIRKFIVMDIRVDTAVKYPELIRKLAKGGLKVVITGFESFRESELKKYRKSLKASLIEDAIKIFQDNGIMLRGNYVVPPDYNKDDFKGLIDYASSHRVVYAGYTILTPMPGTGFYQGIKNRIVDHDLRKYNFFNCVLKSYLPLKEFYRTVGSLWKIKKGNEVI